jgi:phosphoenolpyruvate mutase
MTLRNIITSEERMKKLIELLRSKKIIRGIEVHNGISALVANNIKVKIGEKKEDTKEFDFFWESSLTDSASKGHPDIEIVSFDSRLKSIEEILDVTNKPIIVDGDTGGDIHHFEYLIPRLERLGVSAIIIEDKIFPKRNSLDADASQEQEEPDRFARKITVGKRIQRSSHFMIIARIESLIAGKTVDDALMRAKKYLLAGADGIMIHSKSKNPEEIFEFARRYKLLLNELNMTKPLVCVPTTYNSVYEEELAEKGFNIVIHGNHMLRAAYRAMLNTAGEILVNRRSFEVEPKIATVNEIFDIVGFLDVKEKDKSLSDIPSVVIPAAGETKGFDNLGNPPKALIKIGGKTVLDHHINLLKKIGLKDINIIKGYQGDKFDNKGVSYYENPNYLSKGLVQGLILAKEKMKNGFVYFNSDLLFDERLIKELLQRKEDIVLVIDSSYHYHKHEIDKKLDAVVTKSGQTAKYQRLRDNNDEVIAIGKNILPDKMTHEFIGIAKFSQKGAEKFVELVEELSQKHQGKFHEAESFDLAADTDLFQEMIDRGIKIMVHETNGGWIEIHSEKDLNYAEQILSSKNFSL